MEAIGVILSVSLCVALIFTFVLHVKPHDIEEKDYSQSLLFNADVREDTKPTEEIFETFEKKYIKPHFLGFEEKE